MEAKAEAGEKKTARRKSPRHDVKTKCEAVLSIWSERRRPAEICRELGINWAVLSAWQNRALEGMLQSLSPKPERMEKPPAINPLLGQRLMRKMALSVAKAGRVQQRLKAVEMTTVSPEKPKE